MDHPDSEKRKRRKEDRFTELVEAGLLEFAERGFAGARLEDVARRAGVAKGTIYLYFKDKEQLFQEAVRSKLSEFLGNLDGVVESYDGSSTALLRRIIELMHKVVIPSEAPSLIRILVGEGRRFPDLVRFYYDEVITKGRAILERVIARGVARGEFRQGATAALPMVVIAPGIMSALWRLIFEDIERIEPEQFLEAHLDLIFNGLMARDEVR